jgi:hypothetical protein
MLCFFFQKRIFICGVVILLVSCNDPDLQTRQDKKHKIETVNRQRCSFRVTDKLYRDHIDSAFNPQAYFNIKSYLSENLMQLFVFDTQFDESEKLDAEVKALNTPEVFIPDSIEKISRFGNYEGKGVLMKGVYSGGVVSGTIKVFCYSDSVKGFIAIRQTIRPVDEEEFDVVENSFMLKYDSYMNR